MGRPSLSLLAASLALGLLAVGVSSQPSGSSSEKKFPEFDTVVKGAKVHEGLFKLHQKDGHLYAEIKPMQLNRPFLCPIAIAKGLGQGGHTLNFDEQWVLMFKRVEDKVHVIRRNVRFTAKVGSPDAKAVDTTYTDSVLLSLKIATINPAMQSVVIDLNDIFMTDFAQLNLGFFDSNRSSWHKIKSFPRNIEVEVSATYGGGRGGFFGGDDSVIDSRGQTVVIHYGLCELPDPGYQARLADDRVGYFLSVVKDFNSENQDTAFVRYANRWRLERAESVDPKRPDRLSPPKKKIIFWIEKSVPVEYRAFVREGILEWNKAFEKIGFRDAIEVRQQEDEDFDPEDINYSTFRWINNDQGYAMGPSRANPLTGEIFDADIVFDGSMVRYFKQSYKLNTGGTTGEPASFIESGKRGWGLDFPTLQRSGDATTWNEGRQRDKEQANEKPDARMMAIRNGLCQCAAHRKYELGMAAMALASRDLLKSGEKVPEELIGQAIKEVTMHEVGHTLGLRHNFKASTMLKNDQLHDTTITRKQGLVGSVMDYAPVNIAPKGVKQGDYFSTTIGPYDYWAIEYAYKPLSGGTEGEWDKLKEIAKKAAAPGLDYGTDEDLFTTSDPLINQWDLGSDPMKFAIDRMALAQEVLKTVADKVVDDGEGYQRLRQAFGILLNQYGNAAFLTAQHIGGVNVHRDHRGDPAARDPMVPVKADKQREALKFLREAILTDRPFQFEPSLLRKLAADRWMHWGAEGTFFTPVDYPVHQRILAIHNVVLRHVFDGSVQSRIQNNALKCEKGENPLTLAEMFRGVTDSVWNQSNYKTDKDKKKSYETSIIGRNLQRQHLQALADVVLGKGRPGPADGRSLARMHLRQIDKYLKTVFDEKDIVLDDTTRAHLEECQERIAKVLSASIRLD